MQLQDILDYLSKGEVQKVVEIVKESGQDFDTIKRLKEFHPEGHDINDVFKRPNRTVKVDTGIKDENGKPIESTRIEDVTRIPVPVQKIISARRTMFVTGAGIEMDAEPLDDNQTRFYDMLIKSMEDNKFDFRYGPIFQTMLSEGECAALFYMDKTEPEYWGDLGTDKTILRPRMVLLKPSEGNELYPVFDIYKNMVAFGRLYKIEDKEWLDLYTDTQIYKIRQVEAGWDIEGSEKHGFDKIPVAYFAQQRKEWEDVQGAINRLERLLSNLGDTNDYNGSPIILAKGKIQGFASKGESGKILQLEKEADAKYLNWDNAPESIKLEIEYLFKVIHSFTRTPDISFENLLKVGTVSGVALRLMFLDAHAAAKEHQDGHYGETVQRMINILKSGIVAVDNTLRKASNLQVKVRFGTYIPANESEELTNMQSKVSTLISAYNNDLISQETAVANMPSELVEDTDAEFKKVEAQKAEKNVTLEF